MRWFTPQPEPISDILDEANRVLGLPVKTGGASFYDLSQTILELARRIKELEER